MKDIFLVIIVVIVVLALGIGSWKLKRWFNWEFGYGPKIEQRISELEERVLLLEQRPDSE